MFTAGPAFASIIAGLALSFAMLALMRPALPAPWRWAWQGAALHGGLWLMLHALLVVILGRPWFAMAIGLALLMLLVQVSNAKYHALREVFVFQDFEYFTDAIRHPRLYIPFLDWWKLVMIVLAVVVALTVGLWLEQAPEGRFALAGQLGEVGVFFAVGALLVAVSKGGPEMTFSPEEDVRRLGFFGILWRYARAERSLLKLSDLLPAASGVAAERPDLLVVQSESFFDPRPLYPGIRRDVLGEFDRLNSEALCHGRLKVPA